MLDAGSTTGQGQRPAAGRSAGSPRSPPAPRRRPASQRTQKMSSSPGAACAGLAILVLALALPALMRKLKMRESPAAEHEAEMVLAQRAEDAALIALHNAPFVRDLPHQRQQAIERGLKRLSEELVTDAALRGKEECPDSSGARLRRGDSDHRPGRGRAGDRQHPQRTRPTRKLATGCCPGWTFAPSPTSGETRSCGA